MNNSTNDCATHTSSSENAGEAKSSTQNLAPLFNRQRELIHALTEAEAHFFYLVTDQTRDWSEREEAVHRLMETPNGKALMQTLAQIMLICSKATTVH